MSSNLVKGRKYLYRLFDVTVTMNKNKQRKPFWDTSFDLFFNSVLYGVWGIKRRYVKLMLIFFVLTMVSGAIMIYVVIVKLLFLIFAAMFVLLLLTCIFSGVYCEKCDRKMSYLKSDGVYKHYKCPKGHIGYESYLNPEVDLSPSKKR
jgi:hypothetical protein